MRKAPLALCCLMAHALHAQTDSLWRVWNNAAQPDSARLKAIQALAWKAVFEQPDSGMALARKQLDLAERAGIPSGRFEAHTTLAVGSSMRSDYTTALTHLQQCLAVAQAMGDRKRQANTYSNMSNVYKNIGDLPMALEQLQKSLRIDQELDNKEGLAGTYNNIGNIHTELGDLPMALEHYRRSAALAEELDNDRGRAQAAMNLGSTELELGQPDTAAMLFQRSLGLYRRLGRRLEQGMAFNNLGRAYGLLQRTPEAFASLDSAERILRGLGSMRPLARTHVNRGNLLLTMGRAREAIASCSEGERIAVENQLLQQRRECLLCLYKAYEGVGDFRKAYRAQSEYMAVNDSLIGLNNSKEVTRLEVSRAFQERMLADSLDHVRQQYEQELVYTATLGRERERRNLFLYTGIGVLVLAGGLWNRLRYTRRSRAAIQQEKERSEDLLHNILPVEVARELKEKGEAEARLIESVTVLFTDFKGFTAMSEQVSPKQLVHDLHECFSAFDRICGKHGIEKIKTIGDAYMAAGGLPTPNTTHAIDGIRAALEMRDFIAEGKARKIAAGLPYFEIRIGIHTGPVVAGIVGVKKFQYDIWGDTVNTASRMESSGEAGQVNISAATYAIVQEEPGLAFTPRGEVSAKGKGALSMYFVDAARQA